MLHYSFRHSSLTIHSYEGARRTMLMSLFASIVLPRAVSHPTQRSEIQPSIHSSIAQHHFLRLRIPRAAERFCAEDFSVNWVRNFPLGRAQAAEVGNFAAVIVRIQRRPRSFPTSKKIPLPSLDGHRKYGEKSHSPFKCGRASKHSKTRIRSPQVAFKLCPWRYWRA